FNLETPDSDLFTKEERESYKSISFVPLPPLKIEVLLTVPELDFVLGPQADVPLPTIYKHGILLFCSLFTLLRVMPAWKLHKCLWRRAASLDITLRVRSRNDPDILSLTSKQSITAAILGTGTSPSTRARILEQPNSSTSSLTAQLVLHSGRRTGHPAASTIPLSLQIQYGVLVDRISILQPRPRFLPPLESLGPDRTTRA
ncbi:hypothetical protein C0995_011973, partial [Termitomyces sp. Mi166